MEFMDLGRMGFGGGMYFKKLLLTVIGSAKLEESKVSELSSDSSFESNRFASVDGISTFS